MQNYGYLFGFIELRKDNHHDEVYVNKTKQVVMRNGVWLLDDKQLVALAIELGYGKVTPVGDLIWR